MFGFWLPLFSWFNLFIFFFHSCEFRVKYPNTKHLRKNDIFSKTTKQNLKKNLFRWNICSTIYYNHFIWNHEKRSFVVFQSVQEYQRAKEISFCEFISFYLKSLKRKGLLLFFRVRRNNKEPKRLFLRFYFILFEIVKKKKSSFVVFQSVSAILFHFIRKKKSLKRKGPFVVVVVVVVVVFQSVQE